MPFIKETFKYLKKSVFVLAILAAVPAFFAGLFFSPFSSISFLPTYITASAAGFKDIFWMIFSKNAVTYVYPLILVIPIIIIFASYIVSTIEKHFKTGRLILHSPYRLVNNSILTVLKILPLGLGIIIVLLVLQVSLTSLIRVLITGVSGYPKVFDCIWTIILSVLFFAVSVGIMVFMGVWGVIIQIFGFSFSDAFVDAIRMTSRRWFSLIAGFLAPLFIALIPFLILNSMPYSLALAKRITAMITYLCIIVYYFAYIMVSVYMLAGLERRDKRRVVPKNVKYR